MTQKEKKDFSSLLVKTWREATRHRLSNPELYSSLKKKYWELRSAYKTKNAK